MSLTYDLHSHSIVSDGSLSPTELVARAKSKGVDVLALTDHDATDGLSEAGQAARDEGITLVPGVEVSVTWNGPTIHIVGLGIDPDCVTLQKGLKQIREFRRWRAEEIGRRLAANGIDGALAGAKKFATGALVSRTHFAHYLVESGYAKDIRQVFKRYLVHNKPGHVPGQWTSLENAVSWINEAGGQAVIAHPGRYRLTATKMRQLLAEFKDCGGVGLEVVSSAHSESECMNMARYCQQFDFLASRGSDYHGPEHAWIELGKIPALPEICRPIWHSWH
ncbi:PHP domain-containing protein [Kaarinaea lacus]